MIDNFSLALTHLLMIVAAWRLLRRPDLDRPNADEGGRPSPFTRFGRSSAPDRPPTDA